MKICIITQDDPFYLYEMFCELKKQLRDEHELIAVICQSNSPFGKNLPFYKKVLEVINVFGLKFFIRFSSRFIYRKYINEKTIKRFCNDYNVDLIKIQRSINSDSSVKFIKTLGADIAVSISGKELFKEPLIKAFPKGILNLHTSKLPSYRGLMPVFWALKNKEPKIGISVFLVDQGIDTGSIVSQAEFLVKQKNLDLTIRQTKLRAIPVIIDALNVMTQQLRTPISSNAHETYFSFPSKHDVDEFRKSGNTLF